MCGVLSVLAPFASVPVALVADKSFRYLYPEDEGWLWAIGFVGLPVFGCFLAGLLLAGIAVMRNEKWRALPWLGLLFNLLPFVPPYVT